MSYVVFGFRSGTLDTPKLHMETFKQKHALAPLPLQERMMRDYGVGASGLNYLERRFGEGFESFVLLDEVAVEACRHFNVPLGERVGTIELDEMGGLAIKLFTWAYWTEAKDS